MSEVAQKLHHYRRRHRCVNGETLWRAIDHAIETHDPEAIHEAIKAYFIHVNGDDKRREPCSRCYFEMEV